MNITALREALQSLGLSTSTDGLRGEDRRKALQGRLENAQTKLGFTSEAADESKEYQDLSITDLRRELEKEGVDTATPGIKGAERRSALQQRLLRHKLQPKRQDVPTLKLENNQNLSEDGCSAPVGRGSAVISNDTSPSKRRAQRSARVSQLRDEIQRIRHQRQSKVLESSSEVEKMERRLQQIQAERTRIAKGVSQEDTFVTSVVSGILEEHKIPDILPILQTMEQDLVQKVDQAHELRRQVQRQYENDPECGVGAEMRKISALKEIESELGESFAFGDEDQDSKVPRRRRRMSLPVSTEKTSLPITQTARGDVAASRADQLGQQAVFLQKVKSDVDGAENLYLEAFELDPKHSLNLGNYALFLQVVKNDYDLAEEFFLRSIDADPLNVTNISNYANFLKRVRSHYDRAKEYYLRGMSVRPRHVGNLGNYANFLRHAKKDASEAEKVYLQAIQYHPKHANNLSQYATLLAEQGRFDSAEEYHQRAVQADELNANVAGNFANFLNRRGRVSEAKQWYLKAIKSDRGNPHVTRNYAIFLRDHPEMRTGTSKRIEVHPSERRKFLRQKSYSALEAIDERSEN